MKPEVRFGNTSVSTCLDHNMKKLWPFVCKYTYCILPKMLHMKFHVFKWFWLDFDVILSNVKFVWRREEVFSRWEHSKPTWTCSASTQRCVEQKVFYTKKIWLATALFQIHKLLVIDSCSYISLLCISSSLLNGWWSFKRIYQYFIRNIWGHKGQS